jgi:hypothetical protein
VVVTLMGLVLLRDADSRSLAQAHLTHVIAVERAESYSAPEKFRVAAEVRVRTPDSCMFGDHFRSPVSVGGFDIIEVSSGFITLPTDDWLRLVDRVQKADLKAKPEVGIQFGAGGASAAEALEAEGTRDVDWTIQQAR